MTRLWGGEELVAAVRGRPTGGLPETITGISIDSRTLQPGEAFFAIKGDAFDGHDFATAQSLGLAKDWAVKVIAATGNYGEVFEKTTGEPYHLARGLNALWTQGGLMTALPMQ